jgi:hypothetical protein
MHTEIITNSFEDVSWAGAVTPCDDEPTRESWLLAAIDRMARSTFPAFKQPKWRVTCGWPKGVCGGKHAIGQCWDRISSNDGTYEIFISPELDRPSEILHTLAHEMIHYADFRIMPRRCTRTPSGGALEANDIGIIRVLPERRATRHPVDIVWRVRLPAGSSPLPVP